MNTHSCTGLRQSHELNEVPAYFCNMQKPSKLWKAPMSRGTTDDILAACSSISEHGRVVYVSDCSHPKMDRESNGRRP